MDDAFQDSGSSIHLQIEGVVDDLDLRGNEVEADDIIEKEADEMTRDGLIPKKV